MSRQTGDVAPASVTVPFTISNAPADSLYAAVGYSGDSLATATVSLQSKSAGSLTIAFGVPATLGAGNFTETISLNICTDNACTRPIAGAPASITVNYTVTGSTLPPVSFRFTNPLASFTAATSDASEQTGTFTFYIENVPPAGLYLEPSQPTGGFVTNISYTEATDSAGQVLVTLTLKLVSPASLGSGFFSSDLTVAVCYDKACSNPVLGSPATIPVFYEVDLTPGDEYTLSSSSAGGLSDLAFDSANQQLYATSLAGYSLGASGGVVQLDPLTGNSVAHTSIAGSLGTIALSSDGTLLYAGSSTNAAIYRLTLPSLQSDITIPLGTGTTQHGTGPQTPNQMAVSPSDAHILAVALTTQNTSRGIVLFDDATELSNVIAPLGESALPDFITWGSTPSALYASRNSYQVPDDWEIDTLQAGSSGLSIQGTFNLTASSDIPGPIVYDAGDLYESTGVVRDATTGNVVNQITLPNPGNLSPTTFTILDVTPDSANARVFVLARDSQTSRLYLLIYALPALTMQGVINFGYDNFDVAVTTRMVLWGSRGVAFNRNGVRILSGAF